MKIICSESGVYIAIHSTYFYDERKNILKIPMGQSEPVNLRKIDNTMAKRKRTKGQTTVFKTLHRKHRATRSSLKTRNYLWCNGRVTSSCSTSGIRPVTLVTNPVYSNLVVHLKLFLMQIHTHTHFY